MQEVKVMETVTGWRKQERQRSVPGSSWADSKSRTRALAGWPEELRSVLYISYTLYQNEFLIIILGFCKTLVSEEAGSGYATTL